MDLNLKGKRALVTGASSGIGISIATLLAAEGVKVVVHGRDRARTEQVAKDINASGGIAGTAIGDLSTEAGANGVITAANAAFGGIDILVNNAGAPSDADLGLDFFALKPEQWIATYERNLISALRLATAFAPAMKEARWGRIIQITSGLAYAPQGLQGDYCASKAALNNFTFNLSRALANTGITVNGVSPGMTVTPMLESWLAGVAAQNGLGHDVAKGEEFVLKHMFRLSVARLGRAQDIANAVAFVASPRADYMNGTTIRVDGGGTPSVN